MLLALYSFNLQSKFHLNDVLIETARNVLRGGGGLSSVHIKDVNFRDIKYNIDNIVLNTSRPLRIK